jgi:hypothetical protein
MILTLSRPVVASSALILLPGPTMGARLPGVPVECSLSLKEWPNA